MLNTMQTVLSPYGGKHIVAAVSGGMDSMCMLHAASLLSVSVGFRLTAAHFDHGLRPDSREDAALVRQFAQRLGVPFVTCRQEIVQEGQGLEEAARRARYEFLFGVDPDGVVITAHHMDDLAETVLLNLMRGAGTRGMRGMLPQREGLLRPLLYCSKDSIRAYAQTHEIPYREDSTNTDIHYTRNRIRHVLLPMMRERFNPEIARALARTAGAAAEDEDYLNSCALQQTAALLQAENPNGIVLEREGLACLPPAIQKRVLRNGAEQLGYTPDADGVLRMCEKLQKGGGCDVGGGLRFFCGTYAEIYRPAASSEQIEISPLGERIFGHIRVKCAILSDIPASFGQADGLKQYLDADALLGRGSLSVRTRRQGDVFAPLGMQGRTKTVSDYFTDKRVPHGQRDSVPLLLAGEDIAWLAGYAIADWAKIRPETKRVLQIELIP